MIGSATVTPMPFLLLQELQPIAFFWFRRQTPRANGPLECLIVAFRLVRVCFGERRRPGRRIQSTSYDSE